MSCRCGQPFCIGVVILYFLQSIITPADSETGWDPSIYGTGIGIIDEQHARLFSLAADLRALGEDLESSNAANAKVQLTLLLNDLAEYATLHFRTEEGLFSEHVTNSVAVSSTVCIMSFFALANSDIKFLSNMRI